MLKEERLERIYRHISEVKKATIEELTALLPISKDTVRRDLIKLEEQGRIKRIHGGAMLPDQDAIIYDYHQRSQQFSEKKQLMAKKAAGLIGPSATILFDTSTSVEAVIPELSGKQIEAVTNSLTLATRLAALATAVIHLLPGKLDKEQLFLSGGETLSKICDYQTDYTLLGVYAIDQEGLYIHTEEEGLVKRGMIQQGRKVIAIADHTKIGTKGFFKISGLEQIDVLITDQRPPTMFIEALRQQDVQLIY